MAEVPMGELPDARVAAGIPGESYYKVSEVVQPGDSVTLRLTPRPHQRILSGRVVDEAGGPVLSSRLTYYWEQGGRACNRSFWANRKGYFEQLLEQPGQVGALSAHSKHYPGRTAQLDPARCGDDGLVLQLGPRRSFRIEARNQYGTVIEPSVTLFRHLAGQRIAEEREKGDAQNVCELPSVPFTLSIDARGHRRKSLGPLEPADIGAVLSVELERRPHLTGWVGYRGKPVPGVRVKLHREGEKMPLGPRRAKADSQGNFALSLYAPGRYRIEAWHPDLGLGEAWLDVDLRNPPQGFLLELNQAPGRIKGTVSVPDGQQVENLRLVTDKGLRGDIALDGSFEFLNLPPGWTRLVFRDVQRVTLGGRATDWESPGPPAWLVPQPFYDVEVQSGETVRLTLDLTTPPPVLLEGRLTCQGDPPPIDWDFTRKRFSIHGYRDLRVSIRQVDSARPGVHCRIQEDGSFALRSEKRGEYVLDCRLPMQGGGMWTIRDRLFLSDPVVLWDRDVECGALILGSTRGKAESRKPKTLRCMRGDSLLIEIELPRAAEQYEYHLNHVPAGHLQLMDGAGSMIHAFELKAGQDNRVEY